MPLDTIDSDDDKTEPQNLSVKYSTRTTRNSEKDSIDEEALRKLGKKFPQFEFKKRIGVGGMGEVYCAQQISLKRVVAVKILSPSIAGEIEFQTRFEREARSLASISHPNIVTIFDSGRSEDGSSFLSMELIEGQNLAEMLDQNDLEQEQIPKLIDQICEAIEFAHARGVLHRDIKPANIFIDSNCNAKVGDFGLAIQLNEEREFVTNTGSVLGSSLYIAPERYEQSSEPDARIDVYSLGLLFNQLFTGRRPFGSFPLPSESHPSRYTQAVDDVILRAIDSDVQCRHISVANFHAELKAAVGIRRKPLLNFTALLRWSCWLAIGIGAGLLIGKIRNTYTITPFSESDSWRVTTPVSTILENLEIGSGNGTTPGSSRPLELEMIEQGRDLVTTALSKASITPISYYYRCIDCHAIEPGIENSRIVGDPAARLRNAIDFDHNLLPGSSLIGMTNRSRWFGGDYTTLFAENAKFSESTRTSLDAAIRFCNEEFAQGREMKKEEAESILAYLNENELTLAHLGLSDLDLATWKRESQNRNGREIIRQRLTEIVPQELEATIGNIPNPPSERLTTEKLPDIKIGREIFSRACLSCHDPAEGAADQFVFEDDFDGRRIVAKKFGSKDDNNAYRMIRDHNQHLESSNYHMPLFTKERLSDFQIESLRVYVEQKQ